MFTLIEWAELKEGSIIFNNYTQCIFLVLQSFNEQNNVKTPQWSGLCLNPKTYPNNNHSTDLVWDEDRWRSASSNDVFDFDVLSKLLSKEMERCKENENELETDSLFFCEDKEKYKKYYNTILEQRNNILKSAFGGVTTRAFLDDERLPMPETGVWRVFSTAEELKLEISNNRILLEEISFDNDLGHQKLEGHELLRWIICDAHETPDKYQHLKRITLHSANPVARKKMIDLMGWAHRNNVLLQVEVIEKAATEHFYPMSSLDRN